MSKRQLPDITHLQFLVLGLLFKGERPGREIRSELAGFGVRRSSPAFYQMMARLEDAGLVTGHYDQKVIDAQIIKQRCYRLTAAGTAAWKRTRAFYHTSVRASGLNEEWSDV